MSQTMYTSHASNISVGGLSSMLTHTYGAAYEHEDMPTTASLLVAPVTSVQYKWYTVETW